MQRGYKKKGRPGRATLSRLGQPEVFGLLEGRSQGSLAAIGHMEQLKPIIYEFSAHACGEGGSPEPFYMAIRAPEDVSEMLAACQVICPMVRAKPLTIHGVDGDQAIELSRHFVEFWLSLGGVRLVDAEGRTVQLPPTPKADG